MYPPAFRLGLVAFLVTGSSLASGGSARGAEPKAPVQAVQGQSGASNAKSTERAPQSSPAESVAGQQQDRDDLDDNFFEKLFKAVPPQAGFLEQLALGARKLDLKPKEITALRMLAARISQFKPSGTMSAARVRTRSVKDVPALFEPFPSGVTAIEELVRAKIGREEEVDFRPQKLAKTLKGVSGFTASAESLPDILELAAEDELAQRHLVPFFVYLDACARDIAYHRKADARLHRAFAMFPLDRDRLVLLDRVTHLGHALDRSRARLDYSGERYIDDGELVDRYYEFKKKTGLPSDIDGDPGKELRERFEAEVLRPAYIEAERQRQKRMANVFTEYDKQAVDSLVKLQALQDELEAFVVATVPDIKERLPKVIERDEKGEPKVTLLPPLPVRVEPSEYINSFKIQFIFKPGVRGLPDPREPVEETQRLIFSVSHRLDDWLR